MGYGWWGQSVLISLFISQSEIGTVWSIISIFHLHPFTWWHCLSSVDLAFLRNLRQVPTVEKYSDETVQTIMISVVNATSLKHKGNLISEEILNNNIDIAVITETWLKNTD